MDPSVKRRRLASTPLRVSVGHGVHSQDRSSNRREDTGTRVRRPRSVAEPGQNNSAAGRSASIKSTISRVDSAMRDPKPDLVLERVLGAPPETVWRAWTEPRLLEKWLCRRPWLAAECEIDLQAGRSTRSFRAGTARPWITRGATSSGAESTARVHDRARPGLPPAGPRPPVHGDHHAGAEGQGNTVPCARPPQRRGDCEAARGDGIARGMEPRRWTSSSRW